jgi:hypothetical protein
MIEGADRETNVVTRGGYGRLWEIADNCPQLSDVLGSLRTIKQEFNVRAFPDLNRALLLSPREGIPQGS